jgi:hypothetical protein
MLIRCEQPHSGDYGEAIVLAERVRAVGSPLGIGARGRPTIMTRSSGVALTQWGWRYFILNFKVINNH